MQATVPVVQPIAFAQQRAGRAVCRHDPTAPVELDHAEAGVLEQHGERRAERPGIDQLLPHASELTQVGQKTLDRRDLRPRPAIASDRVRGDPYDAGAPGPVEAHVQAVARVGQRQGFVVD